MIIESERVMEVLLVLAVLGIFFAPLAAVLVFRVRLKRLEEKTEKLQARLDKLEGGSAEPSHEPVPEPVSPAAEPVSPPPAVGRPDTPPPVEPVTRVRKKRTPRQVSPFWKKAEKQFLDNWTGVLGAVIVVLGAGFLSIYAALKMTEFFRFLLLLALAALPAGLFFYLKDREKWRLQALWMRSISGAIFLFACLGSGGIPGLQWVANPFLSLGLLILGIVVNLGLGSLGGKEYFASFHTLLSLLALVIIPPGTTTLFIAGVICLYAIIQTYRIRWDLHLFLTITGFFFYHLFWMLTLQKEGFSQLVRFQGAGAVAVIFIAAALIHYRKNYATGKFELFPFLVHLVNWLYFSVGMILYVGEYRWRTIPLIMGALASFLLADRAGRKGIAWLKTTDTMICQVLTVSALLTLIGWDVRPVLIWGMIFAEILLFVRMMIVQKNRLLFRVGVHLSWPAAVVLMAVCLENPGYAAAAFSGGAVLLSLLIHRTLFRAEDPAWLKADFLYFPAKRKSEFSLTGLAAGFLGLTAAAVLLDMGLPGGVPFAAAAPLLVVFLFALRESPSRGLFAGALFFLAGYCLMGWTNLLEDRSVLEYALTGASLYLAGGASVFLLRRPAGGRPVRNIGILSVTVTTLLLSLALLNPVSPFLPGLFWLVSAAALVLVPSLPDSVRRTGFLFLAAFFIRHFSVHIHLDDAWGAVRLRYLMDLLVLPVLFFWYRSRTAGSGKGPDRLLPYFMEIGLGFLFATVLIEVSLPWIPVVLGGLALLFLLPALLPAGKEADYSRAVFYSLLLFWTAIGALVPAVIRREAFPIFPLSGSLAVLAGLGYLILFIRSASLKKISCPPALSRLIRLSALLDRRIHALLLYPLTLGAALFIYGAFRPEALTFLWALECFLIFSASIFLREEHFRYVSQGGLFLCVIRLILVDLSGTTTLVRGMVFLGTGALMLGVNILYNRYKERFVKDAGPSSSPYR